MTFIGKIYAKLKKLTINSLKAYRKLVDIIINVDNRTAIYETIMALLIVTILVLSFLDIFFIQNPKFTGYVEVFDLIICLVFGIDLYIRYKHVEDKKLFFKRSWIEMLAIIPFDVLFRVFRIFRLIRVMKLTKVSRVGRFANTFTKILRNIERVPFISSGISKTLNPQYFRYKRFKKLLFGYGKSKMEEDEDKKENKK